MERFRRELGFYASSVSSVDQVALARLLESGDYERHVNRVRVRAREARDGLVAIVRKAFPAGEVSIEHADAGLYCVLAPASDKVGDGLIRVIADVGIPCVNIDDCLWANDRTTTQKTARRVLVQYDDLSPQMLDALQNQMQ